jgi:hypothetical protein
MSDVEAKHHQTHVEENGQLDGIKEENKGAAQADLKSTNKKKNNGGADK